MKKTGIVICSHINSSRIKKKPFLKLPNGRTLIECLIERCLNLGIEVIVAVPSDELGYYTCLTKTFKDRIKLYSGPKTDPLKRMANAARFYKLDTVIRICHDKLFVNPIQILAYTKFFNKMNLDYLCDSDFIDGTGFEIIDANKLVEASNLFNNVEHITYAVKETSSYYKDLGEGQKRNDIRLLVDYPEDIEVLNHLVQKFGHMAPTEKYIQYLDLNENIRNRNLTPELSIYTCAYNADKYIVECIESVLKLHGHCRFEYIIVDDCSTDKTKDLIKTFIQLYPEIIFIENKENKGLSSSSNIALDKARGKYIMRLDADDYFTGPIPVVEMLEEIKNRNLDLIYPNYFCQKSQNYISGKKTHHAGCALFDKSRLKELKFREGLRHHDSLDIFLRAKESFCIGYFPKPVFFYRDTPQSMSKSDISKRKEIECQLKQSSTSGL